MQKATSQPTTNIQQSSRPLREKRGVPGVRYNPSDDGTTTYYTAKSVQPIVPSAVHSDPRIVASMAAEISSLFDTGILEVVDLPTNRTAIGCVWVHKLKTDEHREFVRAKSRLCAKGFQQRAGIDDYDPHKVAAPALSNAGIMLPVQHRSLP